MAKEKTGETEFDTAIDDETQVTALEEETPVIEDDEKKPDADDKPEPEPEPEPGKKDEPEKGSGKDKKPEKEQSKDSSVIRNLRKKTRDQGKAILLEKKARMDAELVALKTRAESHAELSEEDLEVLYESDRDAYTDYVKKEAIRGTISSEIKEKEEAIQGLSVQEQLDQDNRLYANYAAQLAGVDLEDYPDEVPDEISQKIGESFKSEGYQAVAEFVDKNYTSQGVHPTAEMIEAAHLYVNRDKVLSEHGQQEREKATATVINNINGAKNNRSPLSDVNTDRETIPVIDYSKITSEDTIYWGEKEWAAYGKYKEAEITNG